MSDLYDGKFVKTKAYHYTEYVIDGTANTEFCDCDKIEKDCWWYLPT